MKQRSCRRDGCNILALAFGGRYYPSTPAIVGLMTDGLWDQSLRESESAGLRRGGIYISLKDFIYLFLERGREGERREKHQCVVVSHTPPTGDLARNPGTCPNWVLNRRPFGWLAGTQSTEPHQPGQKLHIFFKAVGLSGQDSFREAGLSICLSATRFGASLRSLTQK